MKQCSLTNCDKKHYGRGWCYNHYMRWFRTGSLDVDRVPEKHFKSSTSEYHSWQAMRDRCNNENNKSYADYGGRGITVYKEWNNSFKSFYDFIGPKPTPSHTLERINNDVGYEPGNVRWATRVEQVRNTRKRKDNTSGMRNISWNNDKKAWTLTMTIGRSRKYLGAFKDANDAVKRRDAMETVISKHWGCAIDVTQEPFYCTEHEVQLNDNGEEL